MLMHILDIKIIAGAVSVILGFVAFGIYWLSISQRKTTPHAFSHFIWGNLSATIGFIQLAHGAGAGSWSSLLMAGCYYVTAVWAWRLKACIPSLSDRWSLALSLVIIPLWMISDNALLSLGVAISVSLLGLYPTFRKSWISPFSEDLVSVKINTLRLFFSIVALSTQNLMTVLYPALFIVVNMSFVSIIYARRLLTRRYALK